MARAPTRSHVPIKDARPRPDSRARRSPPGRGPQDWLKPAPRVSCVDGAFPGLGTLINVVTIVVGSLLGMAVGHRLPGRTRVVVTDCLGLTTLLIAGLSAISVTDTAFAAAVGTGAPLLIVLGCLLIGGIIGSLLGIEERLEGLAGRMQERLARRPTLVGAEETGQDHRARERFIEGFADRVAGLLHRPADHPGLAVRRARPRRRPALPQVHARRLRRHGLRGVVRLGCLGWRPDRRWSCRGRSPCSGWRSATLLPPTPRRRPHRHRRADAGRRRPPAAADPRHRRSPTCSPRLLVAPLLVQLVVALR